MAKNLSLCIADGEPTLIAEGPASTRKGMTDDEGDDDDDDDDDIERHN